MSKIQGFDYREQKAVERTAAEWRAIMQSTMAAGGKRRVEKGETFVHAKGGKIVAEVYANVAA